jgi:hypothetical protein
MQLQSLLSRGWDEFDEHFEGPKCPLALARTSFNDDAFENERVE